MTDTTTATVEVLTAEVKILQVGSRQVTMSVFKQLDTVHANQFEPLGRVRDGMNNPGLVMVGRDTRSGALVRCHLVRPAWSTYPPDGGIDEAFGHWFYHEYEHEPRRVHASTSELLEMLRVPVSGDGIRVMHWMPGHEGIHCLPRRLVPPEDCPTQDELRREWQPAADEAYAELCVQQDRYDAWSGLPLIVLAGLR